MEELRRRVYRLLDREGGSHWTSTVYDAFMMASIALSFIPLAVKDTTPLVSVLETISLAAFVVDYALRWLTADFFFQKGKRSFLYYPFSVMGLIDLLCILPYITWLNNSLKLLKIFRIVRSLRVLKVFRYSRNTHRLLLVLKEQRDSLLAVGLLAVSYIFLSALILFNLEPDTFEHFFDALYWATISLTTVGYGDLYPTTIVGKAITMFSALLGVAIVALPAGIITAGYMDQLVRDHQKD